MDAKDVGKYIENEKLHKLAGKAIRGEVLDGLQPGEKALIAFYAYEFITQAWSKELAETQKLISEDLNAKFNDPSHFFEFTFGAIKDLILLDKISQLCDALKIMKVHIDKYWKLLDENKENMLEKHKKETTYVIAYRSTLKELLDRTSFFKIELDTAINSKFRWDGKELEDAKMMAGDTSSRNMQRYLQQIDDALGGNDGTTTTI